MEVRGSITVFSALCLMLVASFLFALLEAGRVYILDAYADEKAELGLESVCAEYQPDLWDKYRLLCLDGAYGDEKFSIGNVTEALREHMKDNLGDAGLFYLEMKNAVPMSHQLLTDGEGSVFIRQAASYMKEKLPQKTAELLYEHYAQNEAIKENQELEHSVEDAERAIREARERQNNEMEEESSEESEVTEIKENPLDIVLELKRNAILGVLVDDSANISAKRIDITEGLLHRSLLQGSAENVEEIGWYDRILALEYLGQYFSNFTAPTENHVLSYEMEYVLCGKASDRENIESTMNRLLLIREAANITHIISSRDKLNQALIIANALAGFTGNPVIIKAVQVGIVAAWAYLESIQDVRALIQGDRIALIKNKEQWTIDTENLSESLKHTSKAKNCSNGLTYQEYLKQLLFAAKIKELAYRMLDVMEQNICLVPQYKNVRMDHMICSLSYSMEYQANPIFMKLSAIGSAKAELFSFYKTKRFSYLVGKAGVSRCLFV